VSFDTYGSAIDTALAVYRGDLLDALTPVASDASAASAFVAFEASAGERYRIAVVGRDAEGGDVALTWATAGTIDWTAEPDRLTFGGMVDEGAPAPQSFALRSDAAATAPFRVSTEEAWIRVEPAAGTSSSGAGAQPIEVTVGACTQASEDDGTLTVRGRGGELALPVRRVCSVEATHTLSLSGANGRVAVDGAAHPLPWTGTFPVGAIVALEALPDGGYVFEQWGGALSGRTNPTSLLLDDDEAVTLSFVPEPPPLHPLTVTRSGAGTGSVVSDPPGIDCGATCSADFPHSSSVTLTATASSGSVLASWSGCPSTSGTTCTVEMTEARSLGAAFQQLHLPRIDRIYVNQAVPSQDSTTPPGQRIPLVANRAGLLRVFVTSDAGTPWATPRYGCTTVMRRTRPRRSWCSTVPPGCPPARVRTTSATTSPRAWSRT
jgi:hypothetical protein